MSTRSARHWIIRTLGSRQRAATAATLLASFLLLACAAFLGHRHARRQAELQDILFCRDHLQKALDARRSEAFGPRPKRSTTEAQSSSRAVTEWAAKLEWRLTKFTSTQAPASELEDMDLRSSAATLAIAERRFDDALKAIDAPAGQPPGESGPRRAEILQVRADVYFDTGVWSSALDTYREILLHQPEQLTAAERVAACLLAMQQLDNALQAYASLATRLHDRGSRLLREMSPGSAAQDLNQAITIRIWLFEQNRPEVADDLARSFSTCGAALVGVRSFDMARAYLAQAIEMRTHLVTRAHRADLLPALAQDHAAYADLLLRSKVPHEALLHLDRAIDIGSGLVSRGQLEQRSLLATALARRGLLRARDARGGAAQDFERAAEAFSLLGDPSEAATWQSKAVDLLEGEARSAAQGRLDRYRSAESPR